MFPREYVVSLFPKRGKDRHKFYIGNEKWGKCFLAERFNQPLRAAFEMPPQKVGEKCVRNHKVKSKEVSIQFELDLTYDLIPHLLWGHYGCRSINELDFY